MVVEQRFRTNRQCAAPLEGRGGVAEWTPADGRLTLWSSTQVPHLARHLLAEVLGLPENRVRVVAPDVGGGFGVKAMLYPEDIALCALAMRLGRPVKWVEQRREAMHASAHARDHHYAVRAGFEADGRLLALDVQATCNAGAYSVFPWTAGIEALMAITAVNLGIFLSMFARTEFQAVQFIPLVIVPQFLLSGILFPVRSEPTWLQYLSDVLPLTYAVNALRDVMVKGADLTWSSLQLDVGVVAAFVVAFVVAGTATLRRRVA